jgi:hypothetical protein
MEYWSIGKSDISPISGGEALKPFCEVNLIKIRIFDNDFTKIHLSDKY